MAAQAWSERMGEDERDLVLAAQDDPSTFGPLYELHVDRVYTYFRSRTDSAHDAADLTQQVFVQALDALPRYRDRTLPFAAWLFRIARNLVINFHSRRRETVAWDLLPEALQPVSSDDPTTRMAGKETLSAIFASLDSDQRELLILRFGAQLSHAEIASVLGINETAVRMRLSRILRSLKEQYRDHYE